MSEAWRFDQNISKGEEEKKWWICFLFLLESFWRGEDDKNHGVINGPIAKKIHFKKRWRKEGDEFASYSSWNPFEEGKWFVKEGGEGKKVLESF